MQGKAKKKQMDDPFVNANTIPNVGGDDLRERVELPEMPVATPDRRGVEWQGWGSKLQAILTVLPALSAALYLVGTIYHESYLNDFGIDNSMFPLALDRVWLYGFTSLLTFGLQPMLSGVLIAMLVLAVVMIAAVLSSLPMVQHIQASTSQRIRAKFNSLPGTPTPALVKLVDRWGVLYFYLAGAFLLVITLVFAMLLSSDAGERAAKGDKENWSKGTRRSAIVSIQGEPTATAFQVTCGATHCAFWTGRETRLLRHDQVASLLVYPAKKTTGKSAR